MHAAFRAPNKRQPINEWPYYVAAGTHQRRGVFCRLGTLSGVAKESRWQEGILTCFCVLGWCGHACTLQYFIFVFYNATYIVCLLLCRLFIVWTRTVCTSPVYILVLFLRGKQKIKEGFF